METSKAHVALLLLPGMDHMIPYLGLGKLIVTHYNFKATISIVNLDQSSQIEFKTHYKLKNWVFSTFFYPESLKNVDRPACQHVTCKLAAVFGESLVQTFIEFFSWLV